MNHQKKINRVRERSMRRVRARVVGTATAPRLSVSKSNRALYIQLIDDGAGRTLASASTKEKSAKKAALNVKAAEAAGERIGKKALELGVKRAVFDRRGYPYHGKVRAVAEGARKAGLKI